VRIVLSAEQMSYVYLACQPLPPEAHEAFLIRLAEALSREPKPIGDGALGRAIRALQGEFRPLPTVDPRSTVRSRRRVGPAIA
jgi:hypothetical protein